MHAALRSFFATADVLISVCVVCTSCNFSRFLCLHPCRRVASSTE